MVHRAGAQPGDGIWVTGTIGDGALGLAVAQGRLADPTGFLLDRYRLPQPRVGLAIAGIASAGMDVSDGLVQDLGHLCRAGSLAAEIEAALVPLSTPARAGRSRLAGHLPDRRRRLRTAAGGAAGPRGGVARRPPGPPAYLSPASAASMPGRPTSWCVAPTGKRFALARGGWSHFSRPGRRHRE